MSESELPAFDFGLPKLPVMLPLVLNLGFDFREIGSSHQNLIVKVLVLSGEMNSEALLSCSDVNSLALSLFQRRTPTTIRRTIFMRIESGR